MSIIIFSRSIRSGKTTELQAWCDDRVGGILMPDMNSVRHFLSITSGETFRAVGLEEFGEEIISVGKFSFSKAAFARANKIVLDDLQKMPEVLVIDEIGKLELIHSGLYKAARKAIEYYKDTACVKNLILVIREDLLEVVINEFGITDYKLVHNLAEL